MKQKIEALGVDPNVFSTMPGKLLSCIFCVSFYVLHIGLSLPSV